MKKNNSLKVSIVMGSQSDYKTMRLTEKTLKKIGVSFEIKIISAHRTPKRMYDYASKVEKNNIGVIIAGAGGAAHPVLQLGAEPKRRGRWREQIHRGMRASAHHGPCSPAPTHGAVRRIRRQW